MDGGILGYFLKISKKNMYFFDRDRNTQMSTFNFKKEILAGCYAAGCISIMPK